MFLLLFATLFCAGCTDKSVVVTAPQTPPSHSHEATTQDTGTPASQAPKNGEVVVTVVETTPPVPRKTKTIILSLANQKYTAYEGDKIMFVGKISSAKNSLNLPPNQQPKDPKTPHNHFGSFTVFKKEEKHWSTEFKVWMYWCLFYHGGHAIHACKNSDIGKLGTPDSQGCDRVHPTTAPKLYKWADTSTRVIVNK